MGNGLADDIPYYWVTDVQTSRGMLTLPYYYHFNDQYFLMFPPPGLGSGLENPKPFLTNCMLERIFPADFGERQTISEGYVNSCCFM